MSDKPGNGRETNSLIDQQSAIINDTLHEIKKLLKLLVVVVFIALAVISVGSITTSRLTADTREIGKGAKATSQVNQQILRLVEQCVVDGLCGPENEGAQKVVEYIVDAIGCVLLIEPAQRTIENVELCKIHAVPK